MISLASPPKWGGGGVNSYSNTKAPGSTWEIPVLRAPFENTGRTSIMLIGIYPSLTIFCAALMPIAVDVRVGFTDIGLGMAPFPAK